MEVEGKPKRNCKTAQQIPKGRGCFLLPIPRPDGWGVREVPGTSKSNTSKSRAERSCGL
jgi:hypothetical protein